MFVGLPLDGAPLDRLAAISRATAAAKSSAEVRAGALMVGATGLAPPLVSSLFGSVADIDAHASSMMRG